jgi:hypothetical protein
MLNPYFNTPPLFALIKNIENEVMGTWKKGEAILDHSPILNH